MNFTPTILICAVGTLVLYLSGGFDTPTLIGLVLTLFVLFNSGGDPTAPWNRK